MDIKDLEKTPFPFKVYSAKNLKGLKEDGKEKSYNGFIVTMRVNPRDILGVGKKKGFNFKARVYSKNSIIVEAPALDYSDVGNNDGFSKNLQKTRSKKEYVNNNEQQVVDANDELRRGRHLKRG